MPIGVYERKPKPIEERFWAKVNKTSGCWLWTGASQSGGYGNIWANGKVKQAHRISWELHNSPVHEGLFVCHKCDVRLCVKPDHLFLSDHDGNMADMVAKGRSAKHSRNKGTTNPAAKLNEPQARAIKALLIFGWKQKDLAREYHVHKGTISNIARGRNWTHV